MSIAARHREFRNTIATLKERGHTYEAVGKEVGGVVDTVRSLKRLVGKPDVEGRNKRSWLIPAGVALLAFPDPTISDIVGTALIAAGLIKNRLRRPTVMDVYPEFKKVNRELERVLCLPSNQEILLIDRAERAILCPFPGTCSR